MWSELAERHQAYWNESTIQKFWAGTAHDEPGDPAELSYSLSGVLVQLLTEEHSSDAFRGFLENARPADAGQTAAYDHLNRDLGDLAATFLGPGNWRPNRLAIKASQTNRTNCGPGR